jgi:hypothetical protein
VFDQLHLQVLDRLGERGQLDWSRATVDTMSVRAKRGETMWAQIQSIVASLEASSTWSATMAGCPDRGGDGRQRQRHHHVEAVLEDIPPIRTPAGRRRTRPAKVHADKTSHAVRRQTGAERSLP